METTSEKSVEVLNDLIEINNDRIDGFDRASKNLGEADVDLKAVFDQFASDSRKNVQELSQAVGQAGGEVETGNTASGTIHRAWIDIKATFSGHDRKSILEECERGEDAIKKAYRDALSEDNGLAPQFANVVAQQQQAINEGHDRIKALRDSQV
ncbi:MULTISPECIES: PA2169 family four-helix-bundle protein [unclassified Mucilaginibacter]|uniref:ferritin-like domain-containing protein n=1 Tax=unclassified Mucilaginibacter TaxID=2617802 RepID=UPI002AC955FE|nr:MULTISPECIES: PA2169 family four-helix-bundle protein [unclassified Mucilaginibacter]MEB0264124.1 PA2169 family four-helix-bundle protein [Mucilaginibacter sp. 10I4]MEB0278549.1 PA2169 family four-helix-bundle protein [Mucilaginibacter sp. 10B2]MEB0299260.1 PA2169 family four-helix-bundle protein [Mucilaginibacter sp. 5C4]WPX23495.1 PA2169 family four-helix-bundle protein [Mucilaginibacter sp. 5C4]